MPTLELQTNEYKVGWRYHCIGMNLLKFHAVIAHGNGSKSNLFLLKRLINVLFIHTKNICSDYVTMVNILKSSLQLCHSTFVL